MNVRKIIIAAVLIFEMGGLAACGKVVGERVVSKSGDCPKGPLQEVRKCSGKEEASLHGERRTYFIARGVPDAAICKASKKSPSRKTVSGECDVTQAGQWRLDDCVKFKGAESWACLQCDYLKDGTHHYRLMAFSEDCQKGLYFTSTRHPTETWTSEIAAALAE